MSDEAEAVNLDAAHAAAFATLALTFNKSIASTATMRPLQMLLEAYGGHHMYWVLDAWCEVIRSHETDDFDPFTFVATHSPEGHGAESWAELAPLGIGPARALYRSGECFKHGEPTEAEFEFAVSSAHAIYMSTLDQGEQATQALVSVMLSCAHLAIRERGLEAVNDFIARARVLISSFNNDTGETIF